MLFLLHFFRRSLFLLFSDSSENIFLNRLFAVIIAEPSPCDGTLAVFGEVAPSATAFGDGDVVVSF